jgi:midasin
MKQTKDETLANILDCELTKFIDSISSGTPMQVLAYAWIGLGRLVFSLTIPDIPVDPAVVQDATYQRLRHEETDLTAQINLHEQLESLLTGSVKNVVTERLRSQLSQIQSQLAKSFNLPQRHDVSRLHVFWSEVIQFQNAAFPEAKLQTLLDALLLGHDDSLQRAQVFQGSLAGFYQRFDTIYPEFSDITVALKLAISYVRLGVNLLSFTSGTMTIASPISKTATSLVAFPSLRSSSETILNFDNVDPSSTGIFVPILLGLAASSAEMSLGVRSGQTLSLVETIYEQAVGIWLIDRAREKDRKKEINSLYRSSTSTYHVVSDAQLEEDEFLAMFPTFEDAFESAAPLSKPDNEKIRPMSRIQVSDAISLLHFHLALTDSQGISVCKEDPFDVFRKLRITTIRNLLHRSLKLLPGRLDHDGIHLQLKLLHDNLKHLTAESNSNTSYNFYLDENYQELRKAASVITTLMQRLKTISDEWPDQMVLRHLIERCDCILHLPATSPVAKVLSMIEQLLAQTDDWEIYAHSKTSLKLHRDALVRVIVDWRRLELSCWQTLLDSQTTLFIDELSDWWFHLYDALLRGPLSASNEANMGDGEPLNAYLDSLIPLLDDFIMRSPLGQFHARLRLVQSFQRYTTMVIPRKTSTDKSTLRRINQILHSTCSYYGLFSDRLRKSLDEQKGILEGEIKGFIKLASWKDVNVLALKQSAKKTHHQLYKIVKKFREILRQNIRDQLLPYTSGDEECCELSMGPPPESKQDGIQFDSQPKSFSFSHGHLVDVQRTGDKFYALINSRLKPFIWGSSAQIVDELAIEIITTSKDLAGLTVPSKLLGERRERYVKALQVRKRKAWSDLLKELKRAGLPSNVKPDTLHQNASQTWLRDQPIMPKTSGFDKGEIYFTKLCGSLSALRAAFSTHHSDVSARELQKGMGFLESGFSMAVDMRSRCVILQIIKNRRDIETRHRLAVSVDAANQLQRALLRIKTLCNGDNVTVVDPKSHVASVAGLLCKIENSFLELHSHAVIANELGLMPPAPDRFLDEVYSIANSARKMQERLNQLLEDLNGVDLPCITASEYFKEKTHALTELCRE